MNRIQRINIFLCIYFFIALGCLTIIKFNPMVYAHFSMKVFTIVLLLTLMAVGGYGFYFFWKRSRIQSLLIIGDEFSGKEELAESCTSSPSGNFLSPQIVSSALLNTDSPRARLQLQQLKGSSIAPPHILIAVNAGHFCRSNEGEQMLLTQNLNRLLYLLRHDDQYQRIDLAFTHTEKIPGYEHFSRWASYQQKPLSFTPEQSLLRQLETYKNYSRALIQLAPNEFLGTISFFNAMPTHMGLLNKLIENLLLTDRFSTQTRIFLGWHATRNNHFF
jgi:hypothetical protein